MENTTETTNAYNVVFISVTHTVSQGSSFAKATIGFAVPSDGGEDIIREYDVLLRDTEVARAADGSISVAVFDGWWPSFAGSIQGRATVHYADGVKDGRTNWVGYKTHGHAWVLISTRGARIGVTRSWVDALVEKANKKGERYLVHPNKAPIEFVKVEALEPRGELISL